MKRWAFLLILVVGVALVIAGTDAPDNAPDGHEPPSPSMILSPSVQPSRPQLRPISPPPAMPETFDVVARRNIFVKGQQMTSPESSEAGGGANAPTRSVDTLPTAPPSQSDLLLSGVSVTDTGRVAFLEDVQAGQEMLVHVGDSIPMGKITRITLDAIDYQNAAGEIVHVNVGDGLLGGHVESLIPQPTTQNSIDQENPVLRRLHQHRLEELGGRPE